MVRFIKDANYGTARGILRRLGLAAVLCGTIASATLHTAPARADGDGLRIQRDYERRQTDCAFRWRDWQHNKDIRLGNCIGFDAEMPYAAKLALKANYYAF